MSVIVLNDGRRFDHPALLQSIPQTAVVRMVKVDVFAAKLEELRREWEEEIPQLEQVMIPLPLALLDMAGLIGLNPEETQRALGDRLYSLIEEKAE